MAPAFHVQLVNTKPLTLPVLVLLAIPAPLLLPLAPLAQRTARALLVTMVVVRVALLAVSTRPQQLSVNQALQIAFALTVTQCSAISA